MKIAKDSDAIIDARLAHIDHLLSVQLNEILHHPSFQKLEGTWRGLKFLVDRSETGPTLQIRILNASKQDLLRDLQKAGSFDESGIFKKVHDDVYGVCGAAPFGVLLGDYEFGNRPDDIDLLERMSHVAATAKAPFISAVAADFFNFRDYRRFDPNRNLLKTLSAGEYARWNSFRQNGDSRYVALCLPRILGRLPYGQQTRPVEAFAYEEGVGGADPSKYLWINAAYALATRLTNAFSAYGWCAAIRGVEGGGLVEHLPVHVLGTGESALFTKTEFRLDEFHEMELSSLGFIPLLDCIRTDRAAFFSTQTCQQPKVFESQSASAIARLSAQLPYIMACSRFAHYLKVIARDKTDGFKSRADCERFLHGWIQRYTRIPYSDPLHAALPEELSAFFDRTEPPREPGDAAHPLDKAVINVEERYGHYCAIAWLQPGYQLDGPVTLRIVVDLYP